MMTTAVVPPAAGQHTGHLLLATAFVLVTLLGIALGERLKASRAARSPRVRRTAGPVLAVATTGAAAGAIHLAVAPSHWAGAALYGAFFVVVGSTQLVWSLLLLVRPSRPLLGLTLVANLGVLLLWLQTRTLGVPVGPAAGVRERIGAVDLSCALLELAAAALALRLLGQPQRRPSARRADCSRAAKSSACSSAS
ncbi:MAG: hypothetical protein ABR549_08340 [Mycobacteriales bacterium]